MTTEWKDLYGDIKEEIPLGVLDLLSKNSHTACFVDANHSGNFLTRSLHTGVLIYVMNVPIICFSNNHNNVDISTFGPEFVEMRIARDLIVALRYKLIFCSVPLDGPSDVM